MINMEYEFKQDLVKTMLQEICSVTKHLDTKRIDASFQCFSLNEMYAMMYGSFHEIKEILSNALIPMMFGEDGLYIKADLKLLEAPQLGLDVSRNMVLRAETRVEKIEHRPVVLKYVTEFSEIPSEFKYCPFCSGHTKDDMRGHCCACGGPRGGLA